MEHIALYRKYRPTTFDDMVGQDVIVKILKNQIKQDKISHAYIFSGVRGTGKTTAAKIFARAINCLDSVDGQPCNKCSNCLDIINNETTDVVEMDAASNNGIDNIRQIKQELQYVSSLLKYRVYIIDEAHMVTTGAFNALLKTLEEPPENVVFILATTEQHKIPVTILSRCLRFEFLKISKENIVSNIEKILNKENIEYEKEALELIAKMADGAMRDALSITDRCISDNDKLTLKLVESVIGIIDSDIITNITDGIINYNSLEVLKNVDLVISKGKDLRQLVYELLEKFLEILSSGKDSKRVSYIIDELSLLDNLIKSSSAKEISLKSALVRICNKNVDNDYNNFKIQENNQDNKINNIQDNINQNNIYDDKINNIENELLNLNKKIENINAIPVKEIKEKKKDLKIFKEFDKLKKILVENGKLKTYSALAGSNMYIDDVVTVITNNEFAYKMLVTDEQKTVLSDILKNDFNIDLEVNVIFELKDNTSVIEKHLKENNIEYENID
ncbi:MAG: DNA polymerase III subunit gamma/tau [Clostridia bacterium]